MREEEVSEILDQITHDALKGKPSLGRIATVQAMVDLGEGLHRTRIGAGRRGPPHRVLPRLVSCFPCRVSPDAWRRFAYKPLQRGDLPPKRRIVGIENAKLRCRNILDKIVAAAVKLELVQQEYAADTDNPPQTQVSRQLERLISDKKYRVPALLKVTEVTPETYSLPEHVFRGYGGKDEDELGGELGSLAQAADRALETYIERMDAPGTGENVENGEVEVTVIV